MVDEKGPESLFAKQDLASFRAESILAEQEPSPQTCFTKVSAAEFMQ